MSIKLRSIEIYIEPASAYPNEGKYEVRLFRNDTSYYSDDVYHKMLFEHCIRDVTSIEKGRNGGYYISRNDSHYISEIKELFSDILKVHGYKEVKFTQYECI